MSRKFRGYQGYTVRVNSLGIFMVDSISETFDTFNEAAKAIDKLVQVQVEIPVLVDNQSRNDGVCEDLEPGTCLGPDLGNLGRLRWRDKDGRVATTWASEVFPDDDTTRAIWTDIQRLQRAAHKLTSEADEMERALPRFQLPKRKKP